MRNDMGKIVIDAYRHDDRWGKRTKRGLKHRNQEDDRPNKVSNSRGRNGSKMLGDNLNPLYRWLDKQVNRPWNNVYSELVSTLQGGFTNMEHMRWASNTKRSRSRSELES